MNPISNNGSVQNPPHSIYYCNEKGGGFYRVKSADGRITHYLQETWLSRRPGATVILCRPQKKESPR